MNGPIHPSQSVYHCRIVSFLAAVARLSLRHRRS
jgi:hypothetical protein